MKIKPVVVADLPLLKLVIEASELFPSEYLDGMIAPYLNGDDESIWLTLDHDEPSVVVYCDQERMTEGTWNLYLLAVHPKLKGQGWGKKTVQYIEDHLRSLGARILIIETSGLPEFEGSCAFYRSCGYHEEARIREFYDAGDDKIVFWKKL